jgi:hypothetical protein
VSPVKFEMGFYVPKMELFIKSGVSTVCMNDNVMHMKLSCFGVKNINNLSDMPHLVRFSITMCILTVYPWPRYGFSFRQYLQQQRTDGAVSPGPKQNSAQLPIFRGQERPVPVFQEIGRQKSSYIL